MKNPNNTIQEFNSRIFQLFKNDIFSLFFAVLFVISLLLIFPRTYGVNDNIGILWRAEQGFMSEFNSFFYMKGLHLLYHISNEIPWYGLMLYSTHILSLFIFFRGLSKIENFEAFFTLFLIVYLYYYGVFIIRVGYTSTSIMVAVNSLFAFLVLLSNRRISIFPVLGLGLLFSLSFLIRPFGALVVLVYGAPILGLFLIFKYRKKILLTYFAIFFTPFLLLFIGENLARNHLTSPEYRQYHAFNTLRGKLHERPVLEANRNNNEILEKNNWTEQDYSFFSSWLFFDEEKYNTRTLDNFLKYSVIKEENKVKKYVDSYFQKLKEIITENEYHAPFLTLIFLLIVFKLHWPIVLTTAGYFFYAFSLSIYFAIFHYFPIRIAYPFLMMYASLSILLIFHLWPEVTEKNTPVRIFITIFLVAPLFILFPNKYYDYSPNMAAFRLSLERLQSSYEGKIFFTVDAANSLKWQNLDPLKRYHLNFESIPAGTTTFSPRFYKILEKRGLKRGHEIPRMLVNNPDAYLIASSPNTKFTTNFLNYLEKDYELEYRMTVVEQLANDNLILKLKPKHTQL